MAHLLPLLVLLFLGVHVSHGSPLPLTTYDDSMCPELLRCGVVDIRYPFYLSNATRETTDYTSSYSCGYTDLKIFCLGEGKAKSPILHLGGYSYTILNIFYHNYTMILGDTDVLRGNGCPRVSHNVSFDYNWLNYTDSVDSLAFFFDCYSGDQPPLGLETYQINGNCKGFNSTPPAGSEPGVSFVFTYEEVNVSEEHQLADHCSKNFVVPVHEDALKRSNQLALPSEYGVLLKQGFELEWNTSQTCYLCEQSGGRCAYSEYRIFLGCLCYGGKVGDQVCNGTGATPASAVPSSSKFLNLDN